MTWNGYHLMSSTLAVPYLLQCLDGVRRVISVGWSQYLMITFDDNNML